MDLLMTAMKKTVLISILFTSIAGSTFATTSKEVIYRGQIDQTLIGNALYLSKFYSVSLKSDAGSAFQYALKPGIKTEQLNAGIYKATSFKFDPTISTGSSLPHRFKFKMSGSCVVSDQIISFEGELLSDQKSIGKVKYEFNLFQLPVQKNYNPKVQQAAECSAPDRIEVVEIRTTP